MWTEGDPVTYPRQGQQKYDPFSNTYNPGLRANPAFSWSSNQGAGGQATQQYRPPQFQQQRGTPYVAPPLRQPYPQAATAPRKADWEIAIEKMAAQQELLVKEVADLKAAMNAPKPRGPGELPSQPEANPKEHCKAVTTRSGNKSSGDDSLGSQPNSDHITVEDLETKENEDLKDVEA